MKLLDLFSGTQSISSVFREKGWETYTIDFNPVFTNTDWQINILKVTAQDIIERFGRPDVIWASPDCTSYSIAAIKHHRIRESDGHLAPRSEYAKFCDEVNQHVLKLIEELNPRYYFIENPRGGMRKQRWMQHLPIYTVWYCTYGDKRAKPTDLWTNHPEPKFKPVCRNGNPDCHHERAKRGAKTGTQGLKGSIERSRIPKQLCEHIYQIASDNE